MQARFTSIALALLVAAPVAVLLRAEAVFPSPQASVSFANDIEPILDRSCRSCHGDTAPMGRLDLSSRESLLRGGARGSDLVPGNAEESRLYRRVAGLEKPPMPAKGSPLTAVEIAVVKQWIDEGATWDAAGSPNATRSAAALGALETRVITPEERNYWAFKLPVQAPLPELSDARFTNPIDRFLEMARRAHGADASAASRPPHAGSPRLSRSARPAADAGAGRRVRRRSFARRVGTSHRQSARLAALRRALRPALARRRALRRLRAASSTTPTGRTRGAIATT